MGVGIMINRPVDVYYIFVVFWERKQKQYRIWDRNKNLEDVMSQNSLNYGNILCAACQTAVRRNHGEYMPLVVEGTSNPASACCMR